MSLSTERKRCTLRSLLAAAPVSAQLKAHKAGRVLNDLTNQLDSGLNFYIIDMFRKTGSLSIFKHPLVKQVWELLVILLIPMAIRTILLGDWNLNLDAFRGFFQGRFWQKSFVRTIEYTEGGNTRMRYNPMFEDQQSVVENTDRNNLLQKAIRLYMLEKYKLDSSEMEVSLTAAKRVKMEAKDDGIYGKRSTFSGSYAQLVSFAIQHMPMKGQWMLVDKAKQIWFMQVVNDVQQGPDQNAQIQTKTIFHIKGNGADAGPVVNSWINDAYEFFKEQKKSEQDSSRFFYVAVPSGAKEGEGKPKTVFKQYLLSDQKTFQSLWFPDKELLLKLIDQFSEKKGKFAIPGFPDKLGLLLDGPPGTGKTSLIKALAHYLGRHVVSVNLAKIKTNQELMDLLFDLIFPVQGGDLPAKLQYKDIIFVMEDVDAASKVVYARSGNKKSKKAKKQGKQKKPEAPRLSGDVAAGLQKNDTLGAPNDKDPILLQSQSKASVPEPARNVPTEGSAAPVKEEACSTPCASADISVGKAPPPQMPTLLRMISGSETKQGEQETAEVQQLIKNEKAAEQESESEEEEEEESPKGGRSGGPSTEAMVGQFLCRMMAGADASSGDEEGKKGPTKCSYAGPWSKSSFDGDDDLNLAGLLNVLDGVVDSPGRVVVMTTNHPDRLDSALIRPGRINKRIHLGYVNGPALCSMVEHYMQCALVQAECEVLKALAQRISVTPAQVEQCCAESDDLGQLVRMLESLASGCEL